MHAAVIRLWQDVSAWQNEQVLKCHYVIKQEGTAADFAPLSSVIGVEIATQHHTWEHLSETFLHDNFAGLYKKMKPSESIFLR